MDVKEAVSKAKAYVADIFSDEQPTNIGLEEIEFDHDAWRITVGFSRPWNNVVSAMPLLMRDQIAKRTFKVLTIRNDDGAVISMRDRNAA